MLNGTSGGVRGRGEPSLLDRLVWYYCGRLSTCCGSWLACDSIDVPLWLVQYGVLTYPTTSLFVFLKYFAGIG